MPGSRAKGRMHTGVAAGRSVGPADMRKTIPYVDNFIHLNSAAGSLADRCVHDAIVAQSEEFLEAKAVQRDDDPAVSYEGAVPGTPVLSRSGTEIGTLEHVLEVTELGLFDGIVIATDWGLRFIGADAIEVMLGQPDHVETKLIGQFRLAQGLIAFRDT